MTERYTLGYFDPAPRSPKTPEPLSPRFNWDELTAGTVMDRDTMIAAIAKAVYEDDRQYSWRRNKANPTEREYECFYTDGGDPVVVMYFNTEKMADLWVDRILRRRLAELALEAVEKNGGWHAA